MMALKSELSVETVRTLFCSDYGYQTPKVDTRAAIFKDDKILLVHEKGGVWFMQGDGANTIIPLLLLVSVNL